MGISAIVIGGVFFFVRYLQAVIGLSPLLAALVMIVPAVAFAVGAVVGPVMTSRTPPHLVVGGGLAVAAVGLAVVAGATAVDTPVLVVAGFALAYLGFGPGASIGVDIVVGSVRPARVGVIIHDQPFRWVTAFGAVVALALATVVPRTLKDGGGRRRSLGTARA